MNVTLFLGVFSNVIYWCVGLNINWIEDAQSNYAIEYMYFTEKKSWNEAKSVCQEIGGDLAKIASRSTLDIIIATAEETFTEYIFDKDFWVGLTEVSEGQFQWSSDCSGLTWTSNYVDKWKDNEKCYKLDKDEFNGFRDDCKDHTTFLCERYINQACTMEITTPAYAYSLVATQNDLECRNNCIEDVSCAAAIFKGSDECTKVVVNTNRAGGDLLHLSVKNCVTVTKNETKVKPTNDHNSDPNLNCDTMPITTSTSTPTPTIASSNSTSTSTTTSSISTTACSCPTSTCPSVAAPVSTTCPQPTPYYNNLTETEILEIAREISKNLTIDAKSTGAYQRRLTSAEDSRPSSAAVGLVGLVFVILPLGVLVLVDLIGILHAEREHIQLLLEDWRIRAIPSVITVSSFEPGSVFGSHNYA